MAVNDKPCKDCVNYDPINTVKNGKRGWCAKKSVYPHKEGPGQVFPRGVARVAAGELAKPFIVKGAGIQENCELFTLRVLKKASK